MVNAAGAIHEGVLDDRYFLLRKNVTEGNVNGIVQRDCSLRVALDGLVHRGVTEWLIQQQGVSADESDIPCDDTMLIEEKEWLDSFLLNRGELADLLPSSLPSSPPSNESVVVRSMTVLDDIDSVMLPAGYDHCYCCQSHSQSASFHVRAVVVPKDQDDELCRMLQTDAEMYKYVART